MGYVLFLTSLCPVLYDPPAHRCMDQQHLTFMTESPYEKILGYRFVDTLTGKTRHLSKIRCWPGQPRAQLRGEKSWLLYSMLRSVRHSPSPPLIPRLPQEGHVCWDVHLPSSAVSELGPSNVNNPGTLRFPPAVIASISPTTNARPKATSKPRRSKMVPGSSNPPPGWNGFKTPGSYTNSRMFSFYTRWPGTGSGAIIAPLPTPPPQCIDLINYQKLCLVPTPPSPSG